MLEFLALAQECAPTVAPQTMAAIVQVESSFNPYAIGVVGGRLERQPRNQQEAVATAQALHDADWNFSVGAAQVNRYNLPKYNLSYEQAFDPCESLRVGSMILEDCYTRALPTVEGDEQRALQSAFSCYYSGNFSRGFLPDEQGKPSYVEKVVLAQASLESSAADVPADQPPAEAIPIVPNIQNQNGERPQRVRAAQPAAAKPVYQGPPPDNAPVLLTSGDAPAMLQPVATDPGAGDGRGVTNTETAGSSAIVF